MAIFNVTFFKQYEAHIQIEAENAAEAGEMVSDGDFSQAVEGTYEDRLSEEFIVGGYVDPDVEDYEGEHLCEWRNGDVV